MATNIAADRYGLSARLRVRGLRHEFRYPPGTSVDEIRLDLERHRRRLELTSPERAGRGTLAALIETYLARLSEGPVREDKRDLLQPWADALPRRSFASLTRSELQAVADGWRQAGLSAARANKRISALRVAWDTLAPDDPTPHGVTKLRRYPEHLPQTRAVPLALVVRVLEAVHPTTPDGTAGSKARARLRVLAWTGQPPARVMAIEPHHVNWQAEPPELYVAPRRKGTGARDAWLPLLPEAQAALREFVRLKATGPFSCAVLGRTLTRAVRKVQAELRKARRRDEAARLEGFRVYDLRHSFLTALAERSEDIYAVAEYAGHASLQTTRRYMRGAAKARMRQSVEALAQILPRVPPKRAPAKVRKRA